jgi:hypothetical protein
MHNGIDNIIGNRPVLNLNDEHTYWLGQNADVTVFVPVEIMTEEVNKLIRHSMRLGHVTYVDASRRAIASTRLVSYWLDTKYAEPRFVVNPRKQVLVDALSGNLREPCIIGEYGYYYYVLAITPEYMIVRQCGHNEHLAVFNAEFSSERLNGIKEYLLSLPLSVNLRISYKLTYMKLFKWFNERYIIVEA